MMLKGNILHQGGMSLEEKKYLKSKILYWIKEVEGPLDTPCWEWQKCLNSKGYGQLSYNRISYLAHRVSYCVFKGIIPINLMILHKCDAPACCNYEHLYIGTAKDNANDRERSCYLLILNTINFLRLPENKETLTNSNQ